MQENKLAFLRKVGQNLKEIRKEKQMEVKEIASKLKITPQAYGNIENGKTDLNISRLIEISSVLNVKFEDILNIKNGDNYNFTSQNNSGGYHIQKLDTLNSADLNSTESLVVLIQQLNYKIDEMSNKIK